MAVELDHIKQVMAEADCLFTEADVEGALDNMAAEIRARLSDSNPIVYSVMNGGLIISGKLLPKLPFPMEVGYLHATRYRNKLSGGELFWKARAEHSLVGRTVLIIDDILDAAKIDAGKMQLEEQPFNLLEAVERAEQQRGGEQHAAQWS